MLKNVAYQVLAIYKCNICKKDHQSNLGLPNLLPDPGARSAEMADIKIKVYNNIKEIFKNLHAPTDKFNLKKLTITETDDKGKSKKVKIADIEELSKGGMTEIEKIEAKRGSSPEPPEKTIKVKEHSSAGLALVADESPVEEEEIEEVPFENTGKQEGLSIDEIKKKIEIRIVELNKQTKECRKQIGELSITIQKTKAEIISLQPLLRAINQPKPKGKKDGRKKQKPKSK